MTKDKQEGAPAAFDRELVEADGERARAAIAKAGDRSAELVDAWVAAKNAAAIAEIARDEGAPAPARKAARRALNVLKARGIAIPDRTHVARISGDAIEGHEAWLVPPDGAGTMIILLAARFQSGKHRLVQAVVRDGVGLLELRATELSRSQLKASFDDSVRRVGYAPVGVPVEWARARIALAKLDNPKSGAVLPLGLDTHRDLLGPAPAQTPPHPIDTAALDDTPQPAAVQSSASLHGTPEFAGWLPNNQALQELLMDIGQKIGAAGPEPDQSKVDAIIASAVDAATDRFFEPELRKIIADRMKDAAISILARAGKGPAAEVMAVAQAILSAGLITSPPHEIPFLRGFFQKALAILAERSGGQLSIPVPTPGESQGAPSPAAPGEKTTEGGIILP